MLKLQGIKKDYKVADGYVHALKGIDLEFRKNEFVCILGQSGCGKTTLLNIIGGLDHYSEGDLIVQGRSTRHFKDRDWDVYRNHRIGFVFQSYNLIPHQTVLGNVELALTIAGMGREERHRRAKEALERVGLGEELNKHPNQLSGGQMQRVAIARALVNNPDILLADEPTGALDSKTSVQIMDLIREIAGERLVIMVTHNPELAQQYATRIVKLKDGIVESDSDPYTANEEDHWDASTNKLERRQTESRSSKKVKKARARMNFLTSLSLSARNLLTKKGRTILTSAAGSIGIISVCLVLALSNGFNSYIRRTEEEMLSYYPVRITESTFDMAAVMTSFTSPQKMPDLSQLSDKIYVDSFLTGLAYGMATHNEISEEYIEYLEKMDDSWYSALQYGYGVSLTDNLFTTVMTSTVDENSGNDISEDTYAPHTRSLSALKTHYLQKLATTDYATLSPMAAFFSDIVGKMPGTSDFNDKNYGSYVRSQYDLLAGDFPDSIDEAVLVVGNNNQMTDITLAQLGLLEEKDFLSLFNLGKEEDQLERDEYLTVDFDKITSKLYKLYYNDSIYTKNASYNPMQEGSYPYLYGGERDNLSDSNDDGIPIRISGILRLKEELTYGCLSSGLNLTEATVKAFISVNLNSEIVKTIKQNSREVEDEEGKTSLIYFNPPARNLAEYYTMELPMGGMTMLAAYDDSALRAVGGDDSVNAVNIYATDFDGKDKLIDYLEAWNDSHEEGQDITYTDTVGLLMGMMQTMLNVITYVLVAFTAISLIVSSVMIGIITYVSVVERVKEIGVLRSLGARKQDIKNLFNAETFIIGLGAGIIGAAVTYLLEIPINAIIYSLSGISGIAALPILTAGIMVLISVILTLISGLIPASAAAKKDPVIALRTE